MTINESALKELLGHLVFTHSFRSFDAKEAAEKALERLVEPEKEKAPESPAPPTTPFQSYAPPELPIPPVLP